MKTLAIYLFGLTLAYGVATVTGNYIEQQFAAAAARIER